VPVITANNLFELNDDVLVFVTVKYSGATRTRTSCSRARRCYRRLEALPYDDNVLDWARVHASVHVSVVQADVRQCAYVARVATSPSRCRPVLLPLRG
jgi:hypothetical protein